MDASERAPAAIGRQHSAIGGFAVVLQREDAPCGVMGTPGQSRTAHAGRQLISTTEADLRWCPGRGGDIVGHVRRALGPPDALSTTPLANDLDPTAAERGPSPTGRAPIEGLSDAAVHVEGRRVRVAVCQQA
jgi:hypothetical protein